MAILWIFHFMVADWRLITAHWLQHPDADGLPFWSGLGESQWKGMWPSRCRPQTWQTQCRAAALSLVSCWFKTAELKPKHQRRQNGSSAPWCSKKYSYLKRANTCKKEIQPVGKKPSFCYNKQPIIRHYSLESRWEMKLLTCFQYSACNNSHSLNRVLWKLDISERKMVFDTHAGQWQ